MIAIDSVAFPARFAMAKHWAVGAPTKVPPPHLSWARELSRISEQYQIPVSCVDAGYSQQVLMTNHMSVSFNKEISVALGPTWGQRMDVRIFLESLRSKKRVLSRVRLLKASVYTSSETTAVFEISQAGIRDGV